MAKRTPRRAQRSARAAEASARVEEHGQRGKSVAEEGSTPCAAPSQPFPIVGVGASAGGLEAFTAFLKHLPSDSGMAFVLIQHLDPDQHSQLTDLLSKATRMPVLEVNADTPVEPNHVYVIAPAVCLSMSNGHLQVEKRGAGRNLPIDQFLRSLAHNNTSKAIGIVLSGTASDGTLGLKAVKAEGGITFAQEPSSAKFDGMPRSAIAAGVVDFVLTPGEIAKRLVRLAQHPYVTLKLEEAGEAAPEMESALNRIFHLLRAVTGNDFTHYKHTTIRRRIHRRMVLHSAEKLDDYITYLRENAAEVRALADDLLICVTSFFREPECLETLAAKVFPEILKGRTAEAPIRIWVPGCATGEEAYSIAICLTEFLEQSGANVPIQIFATDISETAVEKARAGTYGMPALVDVSPARLKRFFVKANGGYQIHKSIRESCIFARQNVTKDPPFHNLDLISCCNVLIYFGPVLQRKALATFHYALKSGGILMLGPSESVGPLSNAFSPLDKKLKLYSKRPAADSLNQLLASEPLAAKTTSLGTAGENVGVVLDVQKTAERMLLAQYAPAGVIIDDALNVVHVRGDTGPYLQVASGEPTYSLLKMAREGLIVGLRTAVQKAKQKKVAVTQQTRVKQNGQFRDVSFNVIPIDGPGSGSPLHFMVLFEGAPPPPPPVPDGEGKRKPGEKPGKSTGTRNAGDNARLKQELDETREYLQSIIEEQEASSEELKSANEEAQATNEELETAKEELQSANEELNTVNDELKTRNVALTEVNNDLLNVLTSINVPLVIVGKDLKIRRFTDSMETMLNLMDSDVGRSISDLKPNIDVPDLLDLLRAAANGTSSSGREIQDPKGRWYSLQALPYRTPDNKIDGALFVLFDIDALKQARDYAEGIVETVRQPLVVLTNDFKVRRANQAFFEVFEVSKAETENRFLYDLGDGQWNIPKLREALENLLPKTGGFRDFAVSHHFEGIGRRTMLLSAREIRQPAPFGRTILLAIEDVTVYERAQARLAAIVTFSTDAILSKTLEGIITTWNAGAERTFGYKAGEIIGQSILRLIPPELRDEEDRIIGRIKAGEPIEHFETVRLAKDRHRVPVSLTISPVKDAAGKIIGASIIARDITERKRAEEAQRESDERYRILFDLGPVGIYSCDASGVIRDFNRRASELWGREPKPGDTDERFCGSYRMHRLDGTFMPHEQCPMAEVLSGKIPEVRDGEVRIERPDGSWVTVIVNIRALKNDRGEITGAINCFVDMTERQRAQEEVRRAGERFRFMAEAMPQKIFTATADGVVDYLNERWLEFTGVSFEEIRGWGWTQSIHPDDRAESLRLWKHAVDAGEPLEVVHRIRRADGVYHWHLTRAHAMSHGDGEIVMWIGSNTDIHEEKETAERLRRANDDLKHFAYAASHDLQEPLRMVMTFTQLLSKEQKGKLNKQADQYIDYAVEGAQRIDALLKGMRDYWQASERGEEQHTAVDCNDILKRALLNLQETIRKSGATVTSDSLPTLWAEEVMLLQLFQNLIGNAIKYRSKKRPKVHISAGKNTSGEWVFSVKDNGIGIEPQHAEKIFGMFNRVHGKKYAGTGIGLAICRKVVERLDGRIWVESQPAGGSDFKFAIPPRE